MNKLDPQLIEEEGRGGVSLNKLVGLTRRNRLTAEEVS